VNAHKRPQKHLVLRFFYLYKIKFSVILTGNHINNWQSTSVTTSKTTSVIL